MRFVLANPPSEREAERIAAGGRGSGKGRKGGGRGEGGGGGGGGASVDSRCGASARLAAG
jgi:hypothetical protein